jgi:hypothetical protein
VYAAAIVSNAKTFTGNLGSARVRVLTVGFQSDVMRDVNRCVPNRPKCIIIIRPRTSLVIMTTPVHRCIWVYAENALYLTYAYYPSERTSQLFARTTRWSSMYEDLCDLYAKIDHNLCKYLTDGRVNPSFGGKKKIENIITDDPNLFQNLDHVRNNI